MSQGSVNSAHTNQVCKKCGTNNKGECLVGNDSFGCVNSDHILSNCPGTI